MSPVMRGIAFGSIFVALGLATAASGGLPEPDGQIHACYPKKGRGRRPVRVLVDGQCGRREVQLSWTQRGPQGETGPPGADGAAGGAGSSSGTFANSGSIPVVLTGSDEVVTTTQGQLPGATGVIGGPLTVPAKSRFAIIVAVTVETTGAGAFTCALQVSGKGGASFFEMDRVTQTTGDVLRFTVPDGNFTNLELQLHYRVVCQGTGRQVEIASLTAIASHQPS
jgi:hypothetical protein